MGDEWDDALDEPWNPDWFCVPCGDSGLYADGPAECSCPDGIPRS